MFDRQVYIQRRKKLKEQLGSGVVLLLGNDNSSINFEDNHYPFRQDSTFLYFYGLDKPGLAGIIDIDHDQEMLFGTETGVIELIWAGPQLTLEALSHRAGVDHVYPLTEVAPRLKKAHSSHRKVHLLPPYRDTHEKKLRNWLAIRDHSLQDHISVELIRAVVSQRSIKSPEEIAEIEKAVDIAVDMQMEVMRTARAGMKEVALLGRLYNIALSAGGTTSFPPIVTVNGQILHDHSYDNILSKGQMLLCDCGAENSMHYASDLTRTFPVDTRFTARQRDMYEIILNAHQTAIKSLHPGILFKDVHLLASETLVDGLKDMGLMKGNAQDAVQAGAHALFFQCGLGHMMGLDVHDMENLGEVYVGYTSELHQSDEFGLRSLRLGKALETNFVITVEPGIYMIPELINQWQSEHKHSDFINYQKVETFKDFGGIRMEDDYLITPEGSRLLGKPLPLSVVEIEAIRSQ
jgi:Xaa-Pro aminopeptidase